MHFVFRGTNVAGFLTAIAGLWHSCTETTAQTARRPVLAGQGPGCHRNKKGPETCRAGLCRYLRHK